MNRKSKSTGFNRRKLLAVAGPELILKPGDPSDYCSHSSASARCDSASGEQFTLSR